jgi:hypothetical protein
VRTEHLEEYIGPVKEEMRSLGKLHNSGIHNLHFSLNIIGMIKLRRIGCTGHVECMKEVRNA